MATSIASRRSGRRKAATTLTEIPDHLLAGIFLRLPAAEDLARALADAADFSFSFFPNHRDWAIQDIRDGRVLLLRPAKGTQPQISMELAVCDPLHRGYVLLPPVPDELAASVGHPVTVHRPWCEAFLIPLDEEAETAFSVMCMVHCTTRLTAFVYSSTTGQWQTAASKEWNELFLKPGESIMVSPIFYQRHYAYGCFYWESSMITKRKELIVLDTQRMEFSISDLPPRESFIWALGLAIVEAEEGRLGLFGILKNLAGNFDLCYYIRGSKGESSSQWQLEKTISLVSGCQHHIKTATGRYLLLGKFGPMQFSGSTPQTPEFEYISVDVKTLQLERVGGGSTGFAMSKTRIYTNFPPSLSSPTI